MLWLRWLEKDDARLVWLRANRHAVEADLLGAGDQPRHGEPAHWQYGLAVIVWRLNGKRVPRKRSMEFVIAKAR
jgi:hypothetical protein